MIITLIDLAVKIANGDELPKKIKFHGIEYELCDSKFENINSVDYKTIYGSHLFECEWALTNNLNDEVEIVEEIEPKKIEKIDLSDWSEITYEITDYKDINIFAEEFNRNSRCFAKHINEIIDKINKLEQNIDK